MSVETARPDLPNPGYMDGSVHRFPVRVYWEDTDAGGIVYHATYIRWMERARTEMLRAVGLDQRALRAGSGTLFVVRSMKIDFRRPASFDDLPIVCTQCTKIGGASIFLDQSVYRESRLLAEAKVVCAAVDANGRPQRLTDLVRARFVLKPDSNTI